MSLRRLLPIIMLALLLAPFGRMTAAEAMPGHQTQMASHCAGQPEPAKDGGHGKVDCMIACAAMAPAVAPFTAPPVAALDLPNPAPASFHTGIQPEADPPPPRLA